MPTTTCFGTKVPSSGSLSATKFRRSNKYVRRHLPSLPSKNLTMLKLQTTVQQYLYTLLQQQPALLHRHSCSYFLLCSARFETFNFFYHGSKGECHLKYLLDLWNFVVDKTAWWWHLGAKTCGSWHLMWSVLYDLLYCTVLIGAFCCFLKIRNFFPV